MFLIFIAFLLVLLVSFGCLLLLTRPSPIEKTIDSRLSQIHVTEGECLCDDIPAIFKRNELSKILWVDRVLQNIRLAHSLHFLLVQAGSTWTIGQMILGSMFASSAAYLLCQMFISVTPLSLGAAVTATAIPLLLLRAKRSRRLQKFDHSMPDAIDIISRSLRAGHSLSAALEIVGDQAAEPVRSEFRAVCRQQNLGLPFRESVLHLIERIPSADLQLVVTSMLVQKETGGNLVEVLDRASLVIRERVRLEGEVRIYTAQGRLTAWILGLLPVFLYVLLRFVNPAYMRVMTTDPTGQKLLLGTVVQVTIGVLVIRRIARVKV
jgi:tight adherence protein B